MDQTDSKTIRIFPKERIIKTFMISVVIIACIFYFFYKVKALQDKMLVFYGICGIIVLIDLFFISVHVAHNSNELILWSPFGKKRFEFRDLRQIEMEWTENRKHTVRVAWYLYYLNEGTGKEEKKKIHLPEDDENIKVKQMMLAIKAVNPDFSFTINT